MGNTDSFRSILLAALLFCAVTKSDASSAIINSYQQENIPSDDEEQGNRRLWWYGNTPRLRNPAHRARVRGERKGGFLSSGLHSSYAEYAGLLNMNNGETATGESEDDSPSYLGSYYGYHGAGLLGAFQGGFPVTCRARKNGKRDIVKKGKKGGGKNAKKGKKGKKNKKSSKSKSSHYYHSEGKGKGKGNKKSSSKSSRYHYYDYASKGKGGKKGVKRRRGYDYGGTRGFLSRAQYFRGVNQNILRPMRRRRFFRRRDILDMECYFGAFPPFNGIPDTIPTTTQVPPSQSPTVAPTPQGTTVNATAPTTEAPSGLTASPTTITAAPTPLATAAPTISPAGLTASPTTITAAPTPLATAAPTISPTGLTASPTRSTASPTSTPTAVPTISPTELTASPTRITAAPTAGPTLSPTISPTIAPTQTPTAVPTSPPTQGTTFGPTAPAPRTILDSSLDYGFFNDTENLREPTEAEINALINQTIGFYGQLFTEAYGGDFLDFQFVLKSSTFTPVENLEVDMLPFTMDFDAVVLFQSNVADIPLPIQIFEVMEATPARYQTYIQDYVWQVGEDSIFNDVQRVRFRASAAQFGR